MQQTAVFVIGHSPAIVTETLAACSLDTDIRIHRIILISTGSGAAILKQRLFDDGGWQRFVASYPQYAAMKFSPNDIIRCIETDIRSEDENRAMAEAIFSQIREHTAQHSLYSAAHPPSLRTDGR